MLLYDVCLNSLSKYFPVTCSSDAPMSPAIGDIDLIGFYPSLSRDGAVVSDKPFGTTDYFSNVSHKVLQLELMTAC